MNRSALPLVCGRHGRVRLWRAPRPVDRVAYALRAVRRAVVGQDALDPDPEPGELGAPRSPGRAAALAAVSSGTGTTTA